LLSCNIWKDAECPKEKMRSPSLTNCLG